MKSFINFIKYNNLFVIIVGAVFVITGTTFAANPSMVVNRSEKVVSVDNSRLLDLRVSSYNPSPKIESIKEDADNYYVDYSINNVAVDDYVWKDVVDMRSLTVSKAGLRGQDLGLYLTKQIGEVVDAELSFLKEAQKREVEKGHTSKVATVVYSGIVGKFFNKNQKVFPNYRPVVREQNVVNPQGSLAEIIETETTNASSTPQFTEAQIRALIEASIAEYMSNHPGTTNNNGPHVYPGSQPKATTTSDGTDETPIDVTPIDIVPVDTQDPPVSVDPAPPVEVPPADPGSVDTGGGDTGSTEPAPPPPSAPSEPANP